MKAFDIIHSQARPIVVDERIPLLKYYRIASSLLQQARIYRQEKNLIDLYIILLRFSSLLSETVPFHPDYYRLLQNQKAVYKKKLYDVLVEVESLKPEVQCQVDRIHGWSIEKENISNYVTTPVKEHISAAPQFEMVHVPIKPGIDTDQSVYNHKTGKNQDLLRDCSSVEKQLQKVNISLPYPKEETLSRHSLLGPYGLQSQWEGPATGAKVQYPVNIDYAHNQIPRLTQGGQYSQANLEEDNSVIHNTDMESVLSLYDGSWPSQGPSSLSNIFVKDNFLQPSIRQPPPPPVLAQVHPQMHTIPPSKVADPRPGPAKLVDGEMTDSESYHDLHIPVKIMECFLRLAQENTSKNLETCGVLAGSLKNRIFYITTLIIPKQESTSDSCQTTDEEEIFDLQDKRSLFPLGWIHTHPTQTCFMSSIDLHTHYSYQVMLPEAIAIVMAPTDTSRTHGIFHLSDPSGVSLIRNCRERGFHPHEESPDGSPIYEHCSHVFMNPSLKYDVVDLRK